MKSKFYLLLIFVLLLSACKTIQKTTNLPAKLVTTELIKLMSGTFSSRAQAAKDSTYYDINLVMHPIWQTDKTAAWLYVEQAVTQMIKKPYRQRIYKVTPTTDGRFESKVYTLPNPAKFIHGWDNPSVFNSITPDSLTVRTGCSVFLQKTADGCYTGSTNEKDCESSMRGASYATSEVTVCKGSVMSWDRGWDVSDSHVWGAEKAGYVFERLK